MCSCASQHITAYHSIHGHQNRHWQPMPLVDVTWPTGLWLCWLITWNSNMFRVSDLSHHSPLHLGHNPTFRDIQKTASRTYIKAEVWLKSIKVSHCRALVWSNWTSISAISLSSASSTSAWHVQRLREGWPKFLLRTVKVDQFNRIVSNLIGTPLDQEVK